LGPCMRHGIIHALNHTTTCSSIIHALNHTTTCSSKSRIGKMARTAILRFGMSVRKGRLTDRSPNVRVEAKDHNSQRNSKDRSRRLDSN
jgi:hypothetical protein